MDHLIDKQHDAVLTADNWLREASSTFDVVASLAAALSPDWVVEQEIDPSGDPCVIVFSVRDDTAQPNFVLYEENGRVQVATIMGEVWQRRQTFPNCQRAVAAIVAAAAPVTA